MVRLSHIMLYITVALASTGIVYNTVGANAIFFVAVLTTIMISDLRINPKLLLGVSVFVGYLLLKSIIGDNFVKSIEYDSLYKQQVNVIYTAGAFISFYLLRHSATVRIDSVIRNCFRIFIISYTSTISVTILFLLTNGRLTYRDNPETIWTICAPLTFLFFAIVVSTFFMKEIMETKRYVLGWIILLNTIYVILMSYTTQMVFYFFSLFLVYLLEIASKKRRRLYVWFLAVILIVLIFVFLPLVLSFLRDTVFDGLPDLQRRMNELSIIIKGGYDEFYKLANTRSSIGERVKKITISMNTFYEYPLFGVPFSNYNIGETLSVGGHHEWVDIMARYGLFGAFLFCIFLWNGLTLSVSYIKEINPAKKTIVITFLMYGFVNTFFNLSFIMALIFGIMIDKYFEIRQIRREQIFDKMMLYER